MEYEYYPSRLKEKYENEKYMKKHYGTDISKGMLLFIGALDASENAFDIKSNIFFYMEHLKGNLSNCYSISLDKKKSKWRIIIQMLDDNGNVKLPTDNEKEFLKNIKRIRIKEMSEHYVEY